MVEGGDCWRWGSSYEPKNLASKEREGAHNEERGEPILAGGSL